MSSEQQEKSTPIRIELISGVEGDCIGINDYRVAGSKPWGGGTIERSWTTTKEDVLMAFLTPDEKHKWLGKDLAVIAVNERDQLLSSLAEKQDELRRSISAMELALTTPGMIKGRESLERAVQSAKAALNPISEPTGE